MDDLTKGNEKYEELDEEQARLNHDLSTFRMNIAQSEAVLGARFGFDPDTRKMVQLSTPEEHVAYGKEPVGEEVRKNGLLAKIESLRKTIATRERTEIKADFERARLQVADDVASVLEEVLAAIRDEQVPAVSRMMNEMYRDVMQAGEEAPTAEVGIRQTTHGYANREFELFARNRKGHDKAIGLLAGSERRAVATAFLLALVKASGAKVPFVSDSLLHAVSGVVRTNLINRVVTDASQAVMFALRADLSDDADRQLLIRAAGRTYTVTNQTHVPEKVVRKTASRSGSHSVVCTCGPEAFCDICERVGDDASESLTKSHSSQLVN